MMAVVALTMALTPLMIILNEKLILPRLGCGKPEGGIQMVTATGIGQLPG